ncbi:MAG: sugar ABC transporter substrate-binding protein [Clostridiales bacterium]|nr:sugar ABC transporter substrate-binding protein [Clostridiales bacterium]
MKKKVISIMLVGALVVSMGAMAGCGSSSDSSSDTSTDTSAATEATGGSDDGHTLTVYAWDPSFNIPALEAAAKDYQENVDADFVLNTVEQSQSSDIETLITNVASTGESAYDQLPDIVLFQDHYFQQYYTNYPDVWQDVNDAEISWDDFSSEKLDYSTIDGVHYGVPVDAGTCVAAYRVDLLEQAGYTIDDLTGVTWEEFMNIGEDVYNATGKYLLCMDGDGNDLVYLMLQAEGVSQFQDGEPYIADNETLVEVVNLIVEMSQRNVLLLTNDWTEYTNTAIQGDQVAGVINGNWIIPTIEGVAENEGLWEITTMPTISGEEGYASNGGSSLYITANCANYDLAVDFLAYTFGGGSYEETGTSITYDEALTNGGVVTTYAPAGNSDVYSEGVAYFNDTAIYQQIAEMTANVPTIEQNDAHYSARTYLAAAIINIINGNDTTSELESAESQLRFEMGLD